MGRLVRAALSSRQPWSAATGKSTTDYFLRRAPSSGLDRSNPREVSAGRQGRTRVGWSDLIQVWAPDEEDRQGEHDNPSQQTQGQAQGETSAPASPGNRLKALVSYSGDPGRNARKQRKQSFVLSTRSKRRR